MKPKKGFGFAHAARGLAVAVRQGINMRAHVLALAAVAAAGALGKIERWAWAAVLICCALVITAEMFNTAVERICDRITAEYDGMIRDIKDIAAGAVLVCAAVSVIVGILVFARPEVWENWLGALGINY